MVLTSVVKIYATSANRKRVGERLSSLKVVVGLGVYLMKGKSLDSCLPSLR